MSSLDTSVSVPDLEPTVSVQSGFVAFIFPLLAALYSPDLLALYLNRWYGVRSEMGESNASSLRALSFQVLILTTIFSGLTVATYCFLEVLLAQRIIFSLADIVRGVMGILLGSVFIFVFSMWSKYSSLALAVQATWGLIVSVALGIFAVNSFWHTFTGLSFFAATGIGMLWGVTINMRPWYDDRQIPLYGLLLSSVGYVGIAFIVLVVVFVQGMVFSLGIWQFVFFIAALLFGFFLFRIFLARFDDWVFHRVDLTWNPDLSIYEVAPRVGGRKVPELSTRLERDLKREWSGGLENCVKVLRYTNQRYTVLNAISKTLQEKSRSADGQYEALVKDAELVWKKMFYEPNLIRSESENVESAALSLAERRLPFSADDLRIFLPRPRRGSEDLRGIREFNLFCQAINKRYKSLLGWFGIVPESSVPRSVELQQIELSESHREQSRPPLAEKLVHQTEVEHAIAGLCYLELLRPKEAAEALERVPFSPLGAELQKIAETLEDLWRSENLPSKGLLKLPDKPQNAGHDDSWKALTNFRNIVRFAWIFKRCSNDSRKDLLTEMLRDEVAELIACPDVVLESGIIKAIATDWQNYVETLLRQRNEEVLSVPKVEIPFIYNKPLTAKTKFLLKEQRAAKEQLKEAWQPNNFQPILITGQCQTGKTSLIRTALPDSALLCLIEMRQLGTQPRVKRVLQAIGDEIVRKGIFEHPLPDQFYFEPERIFSEYIKAVCSSLKQTGLIIALDEFEFMTSRTSAKEVGELLSYFWRLAQELPNLSVAFVTTNTLDELNAQFNTPFTQSLQPITLEFLSEEGIAQLLRDPTMEFLPYCDDGAVRLIMEKTAGQPYLVQVCAAFLFGWYNLQVDIKQQPEPLLTAADVRVAMADRQFKGQCKRYFLSVWAEAERVDGELARSILQNLALSENALLSREILPQSNAQRKRIEQVLELLANHQIIEKVESEYTIIGSSPRWRIKVPLFGNWLLNRS